MNLNWKGAGRAMAGAAVDSATKNIDRLHQDEVEQARELRAQSMRDVERESAHSFLMRHSGEVAESEAAAKSIKQKAEAQTGYEIEKSPEAQKSFLLGKERAESLEKGKLDIAAQVEKANAGWKQADAIALAKAQSAIRVGEHQQQVNYSLAKLPAEMKIRAIADATKRQADLDFAIKNIGAEKRAEIESKIATTIDLAKQVNPDFDQEDDNSIRRILTTNFVRGITGDQITPEQAAKINTDISKEVDGLDDGDSLIRSALVAAKTKDINVARKWLKDTRYDEAIDRVAPKESKILSKSILGGKEVEVPTEINPTLIANLRAIDDPVLFDEAINKSVAASKGSLTREDLLAVVPPPTKRGSINLNPYKKKTDLGAGKVFRGAVESIRPITDLMAAPYAIGKSILKSKFQGE